MTTKPEVTVGRVPDEGLPERFAAPPVDIYDTRDALVVVADMPGIERENLEVSVEGDVLTIQGRQKEAAAEHLYEEFRLSNLYREFKLGEEVDQDRISAELKNGVLTLKLPRAERAKPKKIVVTG